MKKRTIPVICLSLIILLLASCGIPENKPEEEVLDEILAADSFFQDYDLKVTDSEIQNREVNGDEKTDTMQLKINATNDLFSYTADYDLVYVVEENAWVLSTWEKTDESYLSPPVCHKTGEEGFM